MAYEHHLFISYKREAPVFEWVHTHFMPQLKQWVSVSRQGETIVFVDVDIETGDSWPDRLERALRTTCLLVPVFSPNYFVSKWCRAEFESMLARETLLGLRTPDHPEGLIFPVLFNDGSYIPEEFEHIHYKDFRPWNYEQESFRNSTKYMEFEDAVKELAEILAARLENPPNWDKDWPMIRPDARPSVQMTLAQLR